MLNIFFYSNLINCFSSTSLTGRGGCNSGALLARLCHKTMYIHIIVLVLLEEDIRKA